MIATGQGSFIYKRDFKSILKETKDPKNKLFYDTLLKRFKENDTTLTRHEILSLLIGFTDKPEYKPYNVLETERLIYKLNYEGKFKEAYDTANRLLKVYPLSYEGLKEYSYTLSKLGKDDSAHYYLDLVAKIMGAMLYSGNGRTPETAIFALGPTDGQHFIKGAGWGIKTMGSGKDPDGNFLDMLLATKNGKDTQMYFNIQHAALKMFDGRSAEEMIKEVKKEERKNKKKE